MNVLTSNVQSKEGVILSIIIGSGCQSIAHYLVSCQLLAKLRFIILTYLYTVIKFYHFLNFVKIGFENFNSNSKCDFNDSNDLIQLITLLMFMLKGVYSDNHT